MIFDPLYLVLLAPAMIFAAAAQWMVTSAYGKAKRVGTRSGFTGEQAARRILEMNGVHDVGIEPTRGFLGDHYDPRHRILRLSPDVYSGRSLASVGIAAHEAGHAVQHAVGYGPLAIRNAIVPLAGFGSNSAMILFIIGMVMNAMLLMKAAVVLFAAVVVFQLINLPVEFDASARAKRLLVDYGIIQSDELPGVNKVLNAAAMTYVAATLTAILQLLYFAMRAGLLGGRRE